MPSPNESQRVQSSQQNKPQPKQPHTTLMNTTTTSNEFAALIGIDWASQEHALCLYDCATLKQESSILEHTPQAIAQWAQGLRERFAGKKIALCLEQAKGPLIYALLEYPFFVLYPVNPATSARY